MLILHRVKLQLPNHAEFSLRFQHSQIAVQLCERHLQVFLGAAQIFNGNQHGLCTKRQLTGDVLRLLAQRVRRVIQLGQHGHCLLHAADGVLVQAGLVIL